MSPPRLLFVCTANMNRSPTGAAWAEHWFTQRFVSAEIRSAGTHAWDGGTASANATQAMHGLGFDLRAHRTQLVAAEMIEWADHVVVMEPMHEEHLVEVVPDAGPKIVRLWEFQADGADHVVDPQGGPYDGFTRSAAAIGEATAALVDHVLAERRRRRQAAP